MKGTIVSVKPDGHMTRQDITRREGDETAMLLALKDAIGGGWLEKVPGFTMVKIEGDARPCVALCDEDGKRKRLPLNRTATLMWHDALIAAGHPGLNDGHGNAVDVLVGDIAVVFGDADFMEQL